MTALSLATRRRRWYQSRNCLARGQRRELPLAKLDVTIGEHLHPQVLPAERSQDTLHPLVRMFVNRSNECHAALTDAGAHGPAGDHLARFLLIGVAKPKVAAVQPHRGDVRSAAHVDRLWLDLEALASSRLPTSSVCRRTVLAALAPATGNNSSSNSEDLAYGIVAARRVHACGL